MEESFIKSPDTRGIVKKYWIYIALGIFAINSLVLDLFLIFPKTLSPWTTVSENASLPISPQNSCSKSCVEQINLALTSQKANASLPVKATGLTASPASPTATPIPTSVPAPISAQAVKEFFVPLGSGTGNSADWTVVDGIGAKIDPLDYGDIKQVTFEVSARIPTGNQIIWIRLYNANTSQAVTGSEVTLSGGTPTLLISSPITLASGNNLYQIQIKTQLKYPANIDMARLRIKTD